MQDIKPELLETLLQLDGMGDSGTEDFMNKVRLAQSMSDSERIAKVSMLQESDIGKKVSLSNRGVAGVLNDIHKAGRNHEVFISVDSKIHKFTEWDPVIVDDFKE